MRQDGTRDDADSINHHSTIGAYVQARVKAVLACWTAAAAAGCSDGGDVEVQPLPPLDRPSPEARAGLPEIGGVWRFAGFEIPAADTARVRNRVFTMTPPGDLGVDTQRLDSIAGRYVREGAAFPFVGEVRRDSTFALVAFAGQEGSFMAGRVSRDTLWLELTGIASAQSWPRGTRAGLVRQPAGEPFLRLVGGAPLTAPVDSAALAGAPVPAAGSPATPSAETAPPAVVERPAAPAAEPAARPPRDTQPRLRPQPQRPPAERPEPDRPEPEPEPEQPRREEPPARPRDTTPDRPRPAEPPPPDPAGPRDTIRFGLPPR